MTTIDCDVAILGSGFGGTLLALIARKLGLSVALIERGVHPRFAIGESSTPLADFKLAAIADRFGLDWLRPFAKYGPWKATYPELRCGLKRGFSFFRHQAGLPYRPAEDNGNALLVAASPDDARSDTHWFRADIDAHFVDRARAAGVVYLDRTEIHKLEQERGWRLEGARPEGTVRIDAGFLLDGTGDGQLLARTLGIGLVDATRLKTKSRALYSHFTGVTPWQQLLEETCGLEATANHTFPCDAAALHQIIDGGWMWVLRFDHGVTSAGFSLDPETHPLRNDETPEAEWRRLLERYPSLARQFARAEPTRPFVRTGRLQRRLTQAAGPDWALLPHTAGFLDAWLSPGIAQTLFAVERLGGILEGTRPGPARARRLTDYNQTVLRELEWMDEITGGCFACFDRFGVMVSASLIYFVAAIYCEQRERDGKAPPDAAFLLADHDEYRRVAAKVQREAPRVTAVDAEAFAASLFAAMAPFNLTGLGDPRRRNMYPAAPGA
ncbi:MAG: hypothetical protein U0793_12440 [Gemmataceae bacterium]